MTKRNEAWVLRYVARSKAETDVPDSVPEYILQRRRWLNGSFFAGIHSIFYWWQLFRSGHSTARITIIGLQLIYNMVNLVFNWFSIGTFYLVFVSLASDLIDDPFLGAGSATFLILRQLYVFSIIMIFIASLGNRPQGSKLLYTGSFLLFATLMGLILLMSFRSVQNIIASSSSITKLDGTVVSNPDFFQLIILNPNFRDLLLSTLTTYGVYLTASLLFCDAWHMMTCFVQYLFLVPSFVNVLMVYAFCNCMMTFLNPSA